jgi:hypothetical protein
MISSRKQAQMKHLVNTALMLNLAIASAYAQQTHVKMTFSGTGGASAIDLKQPSTNNVEENVAGNGTLGWFTFRDIRASAALPHSSSTCTGLYFPNVAGAGLLRFEGGSLLKVSITEGGDCIDLVNMVGHCTLTLKITGGTGRFKNASGVLAYTETALALVADFMNSPVFFSETGTFTGTISGVGKEEESQDKGH